MLRHLLALELLERGHRRGDRLFAGPALFYVGLQRLDGLVGLAVDDGRTDVADDVFGLRQQRIGEQRQHRLQAAPGDIGELELGVQFQKFIELAAKLVVAGQQGAIKIGGKQHMQSPI